VQTGDPNDNGEGDAGYTIPAEENPLEQRSGIISMGLNYTDPPDAHAIRDSAGTQFYITLSPQLHLNKDFTVFGGSLGALRLNNAVLGALGTWAERADLSVRHVVGERDWALVTGRVPALPAGGLVYQPVRYDDERERSLAAADLVVSRAGGNTVAELAAVGMPSVLVPLPGAPGDHQSANARYLSAAGAAILVPDDVFSAARLLGEVDGLLADPVRLAAMAEAATATARRDAAEAVAALVEAHARA